MFSPRQELFSMNSLLVTYTVIRVFLPSCKFNFNTKFRMAFVRVTSLPGEIVLNKSVAERVLVLVSLLREAVVHGQRNFTSS
jgi:hypothetical protein